MLYTYKSWQVEPDRISELENGSTVALVKYLDNGGYDILLGSEESLPCKIIDVLSARSKVLCYQ